MITKYDYIVAADGSGDFTTIFEALNAALKLGGRRRVQVKPDIYRFDERLDIPSSDPESEVELHG